MPRPRRKIEQSLSAKGFVQGLSGRAADHRWFTYFTADGKKTLAQTKTSHGKSGEDVSNPLLAAMARQCFLSRREFLELVDCPLDRKSFEAMLRERGGVE